MPVPSGDHASLSTERSRAGDNSPRGISPGSEVMYVADESADNVYSHNMPGAIDARLASLTLSGVEFGEFDSAVAFALAGC